MQWLLPMAPQVRARAPQLPAPLQPPQAPRDKVAVARAVRPAAPQAITAPTPSGSAPQLPAQAAESVPAIGDLSAPPAAPGADTVLQLAKRDIGKIDKELRQGKTLELKAPQDTLQAKLERGFEQAHAAVPPKWYEGARTEKISTPTGKQVYKVTTAIASFCIYIADDGVKRYMTCPGE